MNMEPTKGELYTATEIAYEISKDNALNQIVEGTVPETKTEVTDEEKKEADEGEREVLPEPD